MMKNNRGQAALVMILVLAMSFIFYSIELNWGRISDLKISTWISAHSAASQMASNFASYTERLLQEYLFNEEAQDEFDYFPEPETTSGGTSFPSGDLVKYTACQGTWLFLKILVIIIIIIIVILSWGTLTYPALAVIGIILMIVSLVLEYAVIMPMQRAMWNKLMQNMQPIDQMRESGVQTGMLILANDTVNIPDRFDMNGNGRWGFSTRIDIGEPYQPNDVMNRLSFYYTERLKHLKPQSITPYSAYQDFVNALGNFVGTSAIGGNPTANGLTIGTGLNITGQQDSTTLGASLFCGGSKSRHVTSLELSGAGLDPIDVFNRLLDQGWSTAIAPVPGGSSATRVQLLVDFNDDDIIARASDVFGADRDRVLGVLRNAQTSNISPLCDPACTHGARPSRHGYSLGWTYGNQTSAANKIYVPSSCLACDPSLPEYQNAPCPAFNAGTDRPGERRLLYNPYLESPIPPNALNKADKGFSYGARFGNDDEFGKGSSYRVERTRGIVFPMLDQMDNMQAAPPLRTIALTSDPIIPVYTAETYTTVNQASNPLARDIQIIYQYIGVERSGGNAEVLFRDIQAYEATGGPNAGAMRNIIYDSLQPDAKQMLALLNEPTDNVAELRANVEPISTRMSQKVAQIQGMIDGAQVSITSTLNSIYSNNSDDDNSWIDPTPWENQRDAVQQLENDLVLLRNTLNRIPQDITTSAGNNTATSSTSTGGSRTNPAYAGEMNKVPVISDMVNKILNYKADDNACAFQSNSASGLFWKKGADRYCSGTVLDYKKKDPKADPDNPAYDPTYAQTNPLYDSEYNVLTKHGISVNPTDKHWPYEDCTYMRDGSTGGPVACGTTSPALWPQDRLDALVYGLPALIALNESLQKINGGQLNLGVNQWYAQAASFIAPKCTASACQELQQKHNARQQCEDLCQGEACQAMDSNRVIQSMTEKYGNNYATCNPQYHGYILQWWYDLQNWMKLTYDWLYNPPQGGLCTGPTVAGAPGYNTSVPGFYKLNAEAAHPPLPPVPPQVAPQAGNVVDCLYQKSYFLRDLDNCWYGTLDQSNLDVNEPVSAPFPLPTQNPRLGTGYPYMTYACKKVIWEAQRYGATNFVTPLPAGLPAVPGNSVNSTGRPNDVLLLRDWPPSQSEAELANMKDIYEKVRAWVQANQSTVHQVKARYSDLASLSYKAIDAMNLFNEGAVKFYNFINPTVTTRVVGGTSVGAGYGATATPATTVNYEGAVYELMATRAQTGISSTLNLPRLPGFAIYGWRDQYKDSRKVITDGVENPTGRWHLARVEVGQPSKLPTIKAEEEWGFHGWSGPHYNCYSAIDIRGDVWARATRWDAPQGSLANFGNKGARIWGFTYSNLTSGKPGMGAVTQFLNDANCPADVRADLIEADPSKLLDQFCAGKNIGRTENSVEGYQQTVTSGNSTVRGGANPYPDKSAVSGYHRSEVEEAFNLHGAFMFNFDPTEESTEGYMEVSDTTKRCWCIANAILMGQGISNYSGAHWAIPVSMMSRATPDWHTQIKFNTVDEAKNSGVFPSNGQTMSDPLNQAPSGEEED